MRLILVRNTLHTCWPGQGVEMTKNRYSDSFPHPPFSQRNVVVAVYESTTVWMRAARNHFNDFFSPSYCCQLCHTVKISRHIYSIHHLLCLFLLSSVVPWIRWTFTGSGTWQDDTGGLSTSSTLPFKLSRYSLTQNLLNITSLWWDQQIFRWKCTFCSVCFKDIFCISSPKFLFL